MSQRFIRDGKLDLAALTAELRQFLDLAIKQMHLDLRYDVESMSSDAPSSESAATSGGVLINFRGADLELLLQRNGELLFALEYLGTRWLGLDQQFHDQLRFDAGDFRAVRLEELKLSARVAAERVRESRQPFHFNSMPSRERRVIHLELSSMPGLRTESEGVGEKRHLVIYPVETK
jgi:spoIIIJ-associated protein